MRKRKRDEEVDEGISHIQNQAVRIQVSRLKARFDHGAQELTKQLKLARGFDRQKMPRRIKEARTDKVKSERLEAEVHVLKNINEGKVARNHLLKQCVRTKRINESQAFTTLFGEDAESKIKAPLSVAESNVLGRLFKSNPVREVLPNIMKGIRDVVGADKPRVASKSARAGTDNVAQSPRPPTDVSKEDVEDEVFEGFSDKPVEKSNVFELSPHENDDGMIQSYNSRLGRSSDDEKQEDDSDGQGHNKDQDPMEITTDEEAYFSGPLEESSPSEPGSGNRDGDPTSEPDKPSRPTTASFLPQLMHGGYYSGSESDDTGYDPDKGYEAAAKQRKNRRGQRERQAIAEKKYGMKAKHLLKAKGAEGVHGDRQRLISGGNGRDGGWDLRRGAVDVSRSLQRRGGQHAKRPERQHGVAKQRKDLKPALQKPSAKHGMQDATGKNQKLHPSWEAARKRKMQNTYAGASAFAGKKITFD